MQYTEDEAAVIEEAERLYGNDDIAFDAAPRPRVSYGANGAYVQAWVFVPFEPASKTA